ncbi:MAG: ATP-binding protein, partial [Cystobacter sp.]
MLALAVVHLVSLWLGFAQAALPGVSALSWPSTGVALAGLYLLGVSRWPAIFVASWGMHLLPASPPAGGGLARAASHTLAAVVGVLLLRRLDFSAARARLQDVMTLLVVAVACTGVEMVAELAWTPPSWEAVASLAWLGAVRQTLGVLAVGAALMLLARRRPETHGREALALMGLLLGVCLWSLGIGLGGASVVYAQVFVLLPLGLWAALRLGSPGAALCLALIVAVSVGGTPLAQAFAEAKRVSLSVDAGEFKLLLVFMALTVLAWGVARQERGLGQAQLDVLTAAVHNVQEGVVICELLPGEPPRLVFTNAAFQTMCGWKDEELLGHSPWEFCERLLAPGVQQHVEEAVRAGRDFHGEVVLIHRTGSRVFSQMHLARVQGRRGLATYFVATHHDVTVHKQLQEKLISAERIAAVGTLAVGVGHEINNPLAYLLLNLEGVARNLRQGPEHLAEARSRLDAVREGAERIRVIVRDLKAFSRQDGEERAMLDVNAVVVPAMRMAAHAVRARARLIEDFGSPPPVFGCEVRLGQVLLNLLVNALQAIPEGSPERHEVRVRTGGDSLGRALVEVSDTGCGMTPQVMNRIFEPFFTTKPSGEGTGLGLAICQQIIQSHGGELRVRSEQGKGSVFTLVLPAATHLAAAPSEPEPASVAESPPRRRILVIDDEPRLAQSMRMLIEPSHDVVITTRGAEALAWVSAGQRFDLVLCDLQMPGTTGMDVYSHLCAHAPELIERLVFISGGAYTQATRDFVRSVRNRILEKPVRPDELLAT